MLKITLREKFVRNEKTFPILCMTFLFAKDYHVTVSIKLRFLIVFESKKDLNRKKWWKRCFIGYLFILSIKDLLLFYLAR